LGEAEWEEEEVCLETAIEALARRLLLTDAFFAGESAV